MHKPEATSHRSPTAWHSPGRADCDAGHVYSSSTRAAAALCFSPKHCQQSILMELIAAGWLLCCCTHSPTVSCKPKQHYPCCTSTHLLLSTSPLLVALWHHVNLIAIKLITKQPSRLAVGVLIVRALKGSAQRVCATNWSGSALV